MALCVYGVLSSQEAFCTWSVSMDNTVDGMAPCVYFMCELVCAFWVFWRVAAPGSSSIGIKTLTIAKTCIQQGTFGTGRWNWLWADNVWQRTSSLCVLRWEMFSISQVEPPPYVGKQRLIVRAYSWDIRVRSTDRCRVDTSAWAVCLESSRAALLCCYMINIAATFVVKQP